MERDHLQHSEASDGVHGDRPENFENVGNVENVDEGGIEESAGSCTGLDGPVHTELDDLLGSQSPGHRAGVCAAMPDVLFHMSSPGMAMLERPCDVRSLCRLRGGSRSRCPVCRVAVRPPHRAHHLERLAATLSRVSCAWAEHGCTYRGPYREGEAHAAQCQFREVECPFTHLNHNSGSPNVDRGERRACSWSGPHSELICHLRAHHAESIWWGGGSTMLGIGSDKPLQTPVLVVPARTINSLSSIDVPRSVLRRQTNHNPSESPGGRNLIRRI